MKLFPGCVDHNFHQPHQGNQNSKGKENAVDHLCICQQNNAQNNQAERQHKRQQDVKHLFSEFGFWCFSTHKKTPFNR